MRPKPVLSPSNERERVHELDIIRGFALMGILLSNIAYFASPAIFLQQTDLEWWSDPLNHAVKVSLDFISSFKFLTMFSFLFGMGFIIFLQRASIKSDRPRSLFIRRIAVLLLFGLIHSFLIWSGDILLTYAVVAPLLLLFYTRRPKTILVWALIILLLPACSMGGAALAIFIGGETTLPESVDAAYSLEMVEQSLAAYGSGTFADIFEQRLTDIQYLLNGYTVMLPLILGMFLLGMYAAKVGLHLNISQKLPLYRKIWMISGLIGIPFNVLYIYCLEMSGAEVSVYTMTSLVGAIIGGPALCIFYMSSIVLLCQNNFAQKGLGWLKVIGKASLSNYLLQSIVCTLIFYNYGFGLFGEVEPVMWLVIVALLIAGQAVLSHLWFKRFQFGPAEWLWRGLTYGHFQPITRQRRRSQEQDHLSV